MFWSALGLTKIICLMLWAVGWQLPLASLCAHRPLASLLAKAPVLIQLYKLFFSLYLFAHCTFLDFFVKGLQAAHHAMARQLNVLLILYKNFCVATESIVTRPLTVKLSLKFNIFCETPAWASMCSLTLSYGHGLRVRTPGTLRCHGPGVLTRERCNGPGLLTRGLAGLAVCKDPGFRRGPYTQHVNVTPGVLTRDLAGLAVCKQI